MTPMLFPLPHPVRLQMSLPTPVEEVETWRNRVNCKVNRVFDVHPGLGWPWLALAGWAAVLSTDQSGMVAQVVIYMI